MHKQNVVYSYNGILLSKKKEQISDALNNKDEPQEHEVKEAKHLKKDYISKDFI